MTGPRLTDAARLHVCHIIYRLDFGGLENVLTILVNRLPVERYRHSIICLTHATGFSGRIERSDVEIFEIHKRTGKDFGAYARVWRLLRRLAPDIVHTRNLPALDMLLPAALALVPALVHSEHGLDVVEAGGGGARYRWLRRRSRLLVDRYASVSFELRRWLVEVVGLPEDAITVIHNGVDTERFRPPTGERALLPAGFAPQGALVIGAVGRLERIKDQVTLARAFVRLIEDQPRLRERVRLAIIGDGGLRAEIESILAAAGATELAWLPGFLDDMPALYRMFDVFVLPSLREGISNTLLEAMGSGLPIIATRVGGNPELVEDGVSGQLVPSDDAPALARAIARYVDDPGLAQRHGAAARRCALDRFTIPAMVANYRRLYESL